MNFNVRNFVISLSIQRYLWNEDWKYQGVYIRSQIMCTTVDVQIVKYRRDFVSRLFIVLTK